MNITNCDFTIAFWVKTDGIEGPLMAIWSVSGKLFYAAIKNSSVILSIHNTIAKANFAISDWNHVAITCEESKIKVFVNGTEILTKEQWNEFFFLSSDHLETENVIGNHPVLFKLPLVNKPFVGALMDLHVIETALSANQISDLGKGNLLLLGSLTKWVFEWRTSTGSEPFSLFIHFDAAKIVMSRCLALIRDLTIARCDGSENVAPLGRKSRYWCYK